MSLGPSHDGRGSVAGACFTTWSDCPSTWGDDHIVEEGILQINFKLDV